MFYSLNITLADVVQMFILYFVLYYIAKNIYKTRAWILVKGLLALAIIYGAFCLLDFQIMKFILESLVGVLLIAIIIMFQPQLQTFVEKVGSVPITELLKRKETKDKYSSDNTMQQIMQACEAMSAVKTGALIVIERKIPLTEYIKTGIEVDGIVSRELLINTFEKNTPLHDGAVIIQGDKLVAATCYLPLSSNKNISKKLGTRHRAAIGLTEETDAVVLVVSEETGKISLCVNGKIQEAKYGRLADLLVSDDKVIKKSDYHTSIAFKSVVACVSVLLWLYVLNLSDPVTTKVFDNVPVEIQNEKVLTDMNKYYTIQKGSTVKIQAKARRSRINEINRNDIKAYADMNNLSITYAVPIDVDSPYGDINYEIIGNDIVNISIEDGKQMNLEVEVKTFGKSPDDMYLKDLNVDKKTVSISGPGSIIDTVDKAQININLANSEESCQISIYDRNGSNITKELKLSEESLDVKIDYLPTKKIDLTISVNGKTIKKEVLVASDDLNSLDEFHISLGSISSKTYILDVQKYLPEGFYYAEKGNLEIDLETLQ